MVDRETLERRLNPFERYLEKLERFRAMPRQTFQDEDDAHDLAERYLYLALESCLDVANHLLADHAIAPPDSYAGLFPALETLVAISSSVFHVRRRSASRPASVTGGWYV